MKVVLIGIRGIPVVYSGFETLAEKLAVEMVKRGHEIIVYCRPAYTKRNKKIYRGVRLITVPTIKNKYFETFFHSLLATLHACIFIKPDLIYFLGVGSTIFSFLPKMLGIKTVVNVDGLDRKREKWGIAAKIYLALSEYLSVFLPDRVITDSKFIRDYYKKRYGKKTVYLPYGFFDGEVDGSLSVLKKYGLKKRQYFVWVGRLVPDNHLEELPKIMTQTGKRLKCVVIGDDFYDARYKTSIKNLSKKQKFIFTGFLKRNDYAKLLKYSLAYIETKRSGGTHPSLVEAMGFGCLIIANNHPANKEVLGESGLFYNPQSISRLEPKLFFDKANYFRKKAAKRAIDNYDWKKIIDRYEKFFRQLSQ